MQHEVAVLIPTLTPDRWLPACLDHLAAQSFRDFEVVVIDNRLARDEPIVAERPFAMRVVPGEVDGGFASAVNVAMRATTAPLAVVLNDDARLRPDWLERMAAAFRDDADLGLACGKVLADRDPDLLDGAGDGVGRWWLPYPVGRFERDRGQYDAAREPMTVGMCAMMMRRSVFDDVGALPASFRAYMEDVDFGLRAVWLGHRRRCVPDAVATHVGSASTGGMINATTVRLSTRNLIRVQARNLPLGLALRWAPRLFVGHAYWCLKMAVKERHPWAWCSGLATGVSHLVEDRAHQRRLRRRHRISAEAFRRIWVASRDEVSRSIATKRAQ